MTLTENTEEEKASGNGNGEKRRSGNFTVPYSMHYRDCCCKINFQLEDVLRFHDVDVDAITMACCDLDL